MSGKPATGGVAVAPAFWSSQKRGSLLIMSGQVAAFMKTLRPKSGSSAASPAESLAKSGCCRSRASTRARTSGVSSK